MKLSAADTKLLRVALRGRSRAETKRLFLLVRTKSDKALLAAVSPAKKKRPARKRDPLLRDVNQILKPILGPAAEKSDLLIEHMAKQHRRKLGAAPKGLADAIRGLRAKKFSDNQIRAGATGLVAQLAALYGDRETVV
jgi:hypothetical protein